MDRSTPKFPAAGPGESPHRRRFDAEAEALAHRIMASHVERADGSVTWPSPTPEGVAPALGPHVYDGLCGVVLFLAAMAAATGESDYRDLCLRALAPLRKTLLTLAANARGWPDGVGIGGLIGLGGFIYTLIRVGAFLGEPRLVDDARQAAGLLDPARIAADDALDIVFGSAGTLLALLALDRATDGAGDGGLELATACGDRLLAGRVPRGEGWGWIGPADPSPLTGFAHGAAGICYALLRLYERTGERRLLEGALGGLAFERGLYSPRHGNWKDVRGGGERFFDFWCYGAPGITLARLGALDVLDTEDVRQDIKNGLRTTGVSELGEIDHLCCGNMGRADVLLSAGRKMDRPELVEQAEALAARTIRRAIDDGGYRFGTAVTNGADRSPAFFTGAAGVGYTLLRLAGTSELPAILLLE